MKRSTKIGAVVVAIVLLLSAVAAHADDLYDLRGPAPEKGQIYTITAKSVGKNMTRTIKQQGKSIEQKFDETSLKKKEVEILAMRGDEITRMRTRVVQDQRVDFVRRGKKERTRTTDRDLHGQLIYSERLKTGWKNSLEDVVPTDKQKRELKEYVPFKEEDLFYPKEKVKVGHAWKIDPALMEKVLGRQLEDFKGTGSGKFLRIEKGDGEGLAVIDLQLELTGKSKDDEVTLDVKIVAKGTAHRSLKFGFDRKSDTKITMSMKGEREMDGQKVEIEFNGAMNADDQVELKKP